MIEEIFKINFNKLKYNSGFKSFLNLLFIAFQAPLVLITMGVCERAFEIEQFGDIVLCFSILNILIYADFGRSRVITSTISRISNEKVNKLEISFIEAMLSIKYTTQNIFLKTNLICIGIIIFLLFLKFLDITYLSNFIDYKYLLIILFIPISFLLACLRGLFEGNIEFKDANLVKILNGWTTYLPFLVMGISKNFLPILALIISLILKLIIGYFFWKKGFGKFENQKYKRNQSNRKIIFENELNRNSTWSFQSNILSPLIMNGDKFSVSSILGLSKVSIYGPTVDIALRFIMLPASFSSAIIPKLSSGIGENKKKFRSKVLKYHLINVFISIFNLVILLTSFDLILKIIFSSGFADKASPILHVVSFGMFFNSLCFFPFSFLTSISRFKTIANIHLFDFLAFLFLLITLTIKYGLIGAATAWTIRALIDSLLMYWYLLKGLNAN